jgi:hypothetical protein
LSISLALNDVMPLLDQRILYDALDPQFLAILTDLLIEFRDCYPRELDDVFKGIELSPKSQLHRRRDRPLEPDARFVAILPTPALYVGSPSLWSANPECVHVDVPLQPHRLCPGDASKFTPPAPCPAAPRPAAFPWHDFPCQICVAPSHTT